MPRCGCNDPDSIRCFCAVEAGEGVVVTGDGTPRTNPFVVGLENPGPGVDVTDTNTVDMSITDDTPAVVSGDVRVSGEDGNGVRVRDDGLYVAASQAAIRPELALAYQASPQVIPDETSTRLTFDASDPDTGPAGDTFTVPYTGVWVFTMALRYDGSFAVNRMSIWLADSENYDDRVTGTSMTQFNAAAFRPSVAHTEPAYVEQGRQLSVWTFQWSSGERRTFTGSRATRFSALYLGGGPE